MGEIKSTLELVMEKTKNLTMSEDEKREGKIKETREKVNGLIQKFEDGLENKDQFGKELDKIGDVDGLPVTDLVLEELLKRVTLSGGNDEILSLMQSFCGVSVRKIVSALEAFEEDYHAAFDDRLRQKKKEIYEKFEISGSAVVPNLDRDGAWKKWYSEITKKHNKILETQKAALLSKTDS